MVLTVAYPETFRCRYTSSDAKQHLLFNNVFNTNASTCPQTFNLSTAL